MRIIPQFLTNLVGTVGLYLPFLGSPPCSPPVFTEEDSIVVSLDSSISETNPIITEKEVVLHFSGTRLCLHFF